MSTSVGASSTTNPFASLQALWQQLQSPGSTTAQSDPLSQLLAAVGQQGTGATSTSSAGSASSTGAASSPGNSFPQFSSQMLQALLALQQGSGAGASTDDSFGTSDASTGQQAGQPQPGQHGHHHHHHMGGAGGAGGTWGAGGAGSASVTAGAAGAGGQSPFDLLASADSGATSQTTANANGSTTTSITYADGSTVAVTTAAPSSTSSSTAGSGSTSGAANVASNNLIEQLIEMQAQLLNPTTTQSITTA